MTRKPLTVWCCWLAGAQAKTTGEIVRSLLVFEACKLQPLVRNADAILKVRLLPWGGDKCPESCTACNLSGRALFQNKTESARERLS